MISMFLGPFSETYFLDIVIRIGTSDCRSVLFYLPGATGSEVLIK